MPTATFRMKPIEEWPDDQLPDGFHMQDTGSSETVKPLHLYPKAVITNNSDGTRTTYPISAEQPTFTTSDPRAIRASKADTKLVLVAESA